MAPLINPEYQHIFNWFNLNPKLHLHNNRIPGKIKTVINLARAKERNIKNV